MILGRTAPEDRSRRAPTLSVVMPCYNEEEVLPQTAARIEALLDDLARQGQIAPDSHAIFVDDGSRDRTWTLIEGLHRDSSRMRGLKLSRNRGHQNALLAGLLSATGDIVISADADLQDDLEVMREMVDAHKAGADVALGVRRDRSTDTLFKRLTAQAYYKFLRWMGVEIVYNHADYRLLSRRAIEALREHGETNLFLRALVVQLGFKTAIVSYDRATRAAGESKYPLRRMISLALGGVTAFSTMPLRYITVLGFLVSLLSFVLSAWALLIAMFSDRAVPGWASTVVPIYLICGVQLTCLGIIGEYIGRIYHETKRRPRYIVETALLDEHRAAAGEETSEGYRNVAVSR